MKNKIIIFIGLLTISLLFFLGWYGFKYKPIAPQSGFKNIKEMPISHPSSLIIDENDVDIYVWDIKKDEISDKYILSLYLTKNFQNKEMADSMLGAYKITQKVTQIKESALTKIRQDYGMVVEQNLILQFIQADGVKIKTIYIL